VSHIYLGGVSVLVSFGHFLTELCMLSRYLIFFLIFIIFNVIIFKICITRPREIVDPEMWNSKNF